MMILLKKIAYLNKSTKSKHILTRQKKKLINYECRVITELRLPYSLDIIDTLPKELLSYAEEVQDLGGIQTLNDMLHKIQDMSKKALGLIEEGFNALEEENEQDAMLSKQYGKRKYII